MFDFTALHALDPGNKAQGAIAVHYDNTGSPRVVEVAFKDFDDGNGSYTPNDAALQVLGERPTTRAASSS